MPFSYGTGYVSGLFHYLRQSNCLCINNQLCIPRQYLCIRICPGIPACHYRITTGGRSSRRTKSLSKTNTLISNTVHTESLYCISPIATQISVTQIVSNNKYYIGVLFIYRFLLRLKLSGQQGNRHRRNTCERIKSQIQVFHIYLCSYLNVFKLFFSLCKTSGYFSFTIFSSL